MNPPRSGHAAALVFASALAACNAPAPPAPSTPHAPHAPHGVAAGAPSPPAASTIELLDPDRLCNGVPEALALGIQAPAPPAPSQPPAASQRCDVSTTAQLQAAVRSCEHPDILLAPGLYDPSGLATDFLHFPQMRRLWAREPGTVVLRFGLSLNQHPNSELHGLVIDIQDAQHAPPIGPVSNGYRAGIMVWGDGRNMLIHDTEVRGHDLIHVGILARQGDGAELRRVVIEDCLRFGLRVDHNGAIENQAQISDIVVRRVGDPSWRAQPECSPEQTPEGCYSPGAQEHGIWLGAPVRLERAQVRDVWWAGIITGNCGPKGCGAPLTNVQILDVDIDRIGVGDGLFRAGSALAIERVSHDVTVERFCVGPAVERGLNVEWNHNRPDESARSLTFVTGVISAGLVGVFLDAGVYDTRLHSLLIKSATWAGVGMNCYTQTEQSTCSTTTLSELRFDTQTDCDVAHGRYDDEYRCVEAE